MINDIAQARTNLTVLRVDKVSKVFDMHTNKVHALKDASFEAKTGEFIGLIGTSGCGKTTLINVIAGLLETSSGFITINNHEITKMSQIDIRDFRLRSIGLVFQDHLLVDSLTALENVELPLLFGKIPEVERKQRAMELLEKFKLEDKANHKPATLSGGEQQRVGIARSLVYNPMLILADEPTGDLDTKSGNMVIKDAIVSLTGSPLSI